MAEHFIQEPRSEFKVLKRVNFAKIDIEQILSTKILEDILTEMGIEEDLTKLSIEEDLTVMGIEEDLTEMGIEWDLTEMGIEDLTKNIPVEPKSNTMPELLVLTEKILKEDFTKIAREDALLEMAREEQLFLTIYTMKKYHAEKAIDAALTKSQNLKNLS